MTTRLSSNATMSGDQAITGNDDNDRGLLERYLSLTKSGEIKKDPHQMRALLELDRLRSEICSQPPSKREDGSAVGSTKSGKQLNENVDEGLTFFPIAPRTSWKENEIDAQSGGGNGVMSIFDGFLSWPLSEDENTTWRGARKAGFQGPPKGVYLHGGVGCGKSYCMNLFFDSLSPSSAVTLWGKQKVHFHKFMLNVHRQMHLAKQMKGLRGDDVIDYVIQSTIAEGKILCFDEFQVTDIADALLLKRLFTGLIGNGTVIVATSNRPPTDLYKGGLQRDLFLPFIELLEEKCTVVSMWESEVDYRVVGSGGNDAERSGTPAHQRVYFADDDGPPGSAKKDFIELFRTMTKDSIVAPMVIDVRGRQIAIPHVSVTFEIARFSFDDLCRTPKGAADYLAIGEMYHTIFIEDVPKIKYHEVNLVRRWITLIDALYECNVKVVIHAASDPENMFQVDLDSANDEGFAFDRTRSRMEEMRSGVYLKKKWAGAQYDVNGDGVLDEAELALRDRNRSDRDLM